MTYDPFQLSFAFLAGAAMGAAYLTVLWIAVRRLTNTTRPALLLGSAPLRIGFMLAGWYWIADGRWDGLVACLLGFLCARMVATRLAARKNLKHLTTL